MVNVATNSAQTTEFGAALNLYLDGLQDKSAKDFVELCRTHGEASSPAQVFNAVLRATHNDKLPKSRLYKIFGRIADGLKDYSEVIGQLASAQPLPLAIIWGSVRVVVEGVTRCRDLFELMEAQFDALATHIEHIKEFKALYGQSSTMQQLFLQSYIDMFRFWHGAYQACSSNGLKRVVNSLTSRALQKLKGIVADIEKDVTKIRHEAELCLARLAHREHRDAREAREAEMAERVAAAQERAAQSLFRTQQMAVNSQTLCIHIRQLLKCASGSDGYNDEFHKRTLASIHDRASCFWLTLDPTFVKWSTDSSLQSSVLCLEGPSGSGKTVLTSFMVDHMNCSVPPLAAVYYFCQFSQNFTQLVEPFQLVASQLFEIYFSRGFPVSTSLCDQVLLCTSRDGYKKLVRDFVDSLGGAFFFIDGLDEAVVEPALGHATRVLNFLSEVCKETDGRARLWCSFASAVSPPSYYSKIAAGCKGEYTIDLGKRLEPRVHVAELIRTRLRAFQEHLSYFQDGGASDADKEAIHRAEESLVAEAEGNFLWAHLMTTGLHEDGVRTAEALFWHASRTRVSKRQWLPSSYDEIYAAHFQRRILKKDRILASKVMALVAYSRRHLCAGELREAAMTLLLKGKKNDAHLRSRPAPEAFLALFSVHVHVDPGQDGVISWSSICRLDHASVRDFLLKHPSPWGDATSPNSSITPLVVADACLSYIERPVYRTLLRRPGASGSKAACAWVDGHNTEMGDPTHHFIQYAIKYWARHLEEPKTKDDSSLRSRTTAFLGSDNFQTLLQMQILWVEGQFCVYSVAGRPSVLRVLPDWLIASSRRATPQWNDYIVLHHNWARVLNCGNCHDTEPCSVRPHRGEIDRIWWGTLGHGHSFSTFKARYPSYRLECPTSSAAFVPGNKFEALVIDNGIIYIARYTSKAKFLCQRWSVSGYESAPQLLSEQTIATSTDNTNWALYNGRTSCSGTELYAKPVEFSADGRVLRIGSQLFVLHPGSQTYRSLDVSPGSRTSYPPFLDDMASCGAILAVSSRQHSVAKQVLATKVGPGILDADILRLEMLAVQRRYDPDVGYFSASESSSTSSDCDWEGAESWSEGSTDDDDDEIMTDSDSSDTSQDEASDLERAGDLREADSGSSRPPSPVDPTSMPQFQELDSDEEEAYWAKQVMNEFRKSGATSSSRRPRCFSGSDGLSDADSESSASCGSSRRDEAEPPWMSLTVLRMDENSSLTTIFQYRHPARLILYDSPPAIHPHKPLVVWPLGAGEILFADFDMRTYFVRKVRSSATRTRHLSVKLRFSPCGKYLHIASLEAQLCEISHEIHLPGLGDFKPKLPALRLHVFVSTYRLSAGKTTRSPPTLVHRAKAFLGDYLELRASQLPFTFSWAEDALFVTVRNVDLNVLRIPLFKPADSSASKPTAPSQTVFLPDNAPNRAVHFVPATTDGTTAFIVLGSESNQPADMSAVFATKTLQGALSPPICCMLDEQRDLGEWISAEEKPVPLPSEAGNLEHRREKFDPEDDCEVTPYVRFT